MKYKRYPKYKDSGVEILGEIPEQWATKRVKSITSTHKQGYYTEEAYVDEGVKLARISDIDDFGNVSFESMPSVNISASDKRSFALHDGDFLFARSGTIGRFGIVRNPEPSVFASYLIRYRFKECLPEFLRFAFGSKLFQEGLISTLHGGANQNVHAENINEQLLAIPPTSEQAIIATFLSRETEKIDALVAKKERLIELLHEKRTALMTRAVTKGIDPHVPVKDSGAEWIGEIPAHWVMKKLKHVCERVFVGIAEATTFAYVDDGVPLLRSTDVRANRVCTDDIRQIDRSFADRLQSKQLRTGDIVTVRTGNAGVSAVVPSDYDGGQCFTLVISRPKKGHDSRYFCYWLNAAPGQQQFAVEGMGTAQVNISVPIVQNATVCEPPRVEQEHIADWIAQKVSRLDELMAKVQDAIDHLKEYRTALVSAAVTGKIDVREEVG